MFSVKSAKRVTAELFVITVADYPTQFKIDTNDAHSFVILYETIFEIIQIYYQNIFQIIHQRGESPAKLAFDYLQDRIK